MVLSYFFGQKFMPINYNLKKIAFYILFALALFGISLLINTPYVVLNIALKTVLLVIFAVVVVKKDLPLSELAFLKKKV